MRGWVEQRVLTVSRSIQTHGITTHDCVITTMRQGYTTLSAWGPKSTIQEATSFASFRKADSAIM